MGTYHVASTRPQLSRRTLFGIPIPKAQTNPDTSSDPVPHFIIKVKDRLEELLKRTNLSIWLMIDRLDEIFPRRTTLETLALRGLLRCLRLFSTDLIRVKIFLRDDMLDRSFGDHNG